MARLASHVREQIRAANDIVEVIGGYIPLRRSGASFVALCPFHREKTPSFHVSPARQAYHCFGCQKGGDVFRFVQEYENISFNEAAKRLADRAGIRIEFEDAPAHREEDAIRERLRELHEQITRRWQQALESDAAGQPARDYVAKRGLSADIVKQFRLGYAPDAWDDTVNWARSRGLDLRLVEQAGLIIPRNPDDPSRGYYDRFRGRLMFPISDEQGRVIAFSGRILRADQNTAKYVNSPETAIFSKSRALYGLDKARRPMLETGSALICEGQIDLIACHSAGVRNVVAPQGTALTSEHLRILRRYAQEVILCFDADNAGQRAAARVLDDLLGSGLTIRVMTLPAPHDPDSYIRTHGAEAFRQLVAGARDFFEFYLDHLARRENLATDRGRLAVIEGMATAVGRTGSDVLLDRYAQRTAMVLAAGGGMAMSPDAMRLEFRKRLARASSRPAGALSSAGAAADAPAASPPQPPSAAEAWLLKLMFLEDAFAGWLALHLDPAWIRHDTVRRIVERRLEQHRDSTWQSPAAFLGELEDPAMRALVSEALAVSRAIPSPEIQLADVVTRLRNACYDLEITACSARAAVPELPDSERVALLQRIQELRRLRREPLSARL